MRLGLRYALSVSLAGGEGQQNCSSRMVAKVVARFHCHFDNSSFPSVRVVLTSPRKRRMWPGIVGTPSPDFDTADHCIGSGPVGDEPGYVAVGGEDVHENVWCSLRSGVGVVVVHRHEVARGDRPGNDDR